MGAAEYDLRTKNRKTKKPGQYTRKEWNGREIGETVECRPTRRYSWYGVRGGRGGPAVPTRAHGHLTLRRRRPRIIDISIIRGRRRHGCVKATGSRQGPRQTTATRGRGSRRSILIYGRRSRRCHGKPNDLSGGRFCFSHVTANAAIEISLFCGREFLYATRG